MSSLDSKVPFRLFEIFIIIIVIIFTYFATKIEFNKPIPGRKNSYLLFEQGNNNLF